MPQDPPARPSSAWAGQEPVSGKFGYVPSASQRADSDRGNPADGAAFVGAAAGEVAGQLPRRVAATRPPSAKAAPGEDLVSKLKAPFATVTKKRKQARPAPQASAAASAKPRPEPGRPAIAAAPQSARTESANRHQDAQLVIARIEPWSVMKFSFIVSLVGWIVLFVAIALLYYALRAFGVFHYLEQTVSTVTSSKGHAGSNAAAWFSTSTVLGYTMLVGAINVILFTALSTVGAVVYNLITHLSGGVEVTMREAD